MESAVKILAPFDQSHRSQATIPLLRQLAGLSQTEVEVTLLSVAHGAPGTPLERSVREAVTVTLYTESLPVRLPHIDQRIAESPTQRAARVLGELDDYLLEIAGRLPSGLRVNIETYIADRPGTVITDSARRRRVDMILMATRSRPRATRLMFGTTTEAVVDSGVAPALVVHADGWVVAEQVDAELHLTRRERPARKPS